MELATAEPHLANVDYKAIQKEMSERTFKNESSRSGGGSGISYYDLVAQNREYRFFITSFLITTLGEWLTYIASIDFIENTEMAKKDGTTSRTAISLLIIVRLLPNVFLACCGGTLADAHDRRNIMIVLNIAGAACALIFVLAYQIQSVFLIYFATFLQQCVAGLYQPSSSSIIPMLVHGDEELKKATTLEGLCWSGMAGIGAAASGFVVDAFGSRTCFLMDGATFLISAVLLRMIRGDYNASEHNAGGDQNNNNSYESPWEQFKGMTRDGAHYLATSYFGGVVLLKFTTSLAYGACDVLNVAFSEMGDDHTEDGSNSNERLGILFSLVGIGCLLGPLLFEPFIDVERPKTAQFSCVVGLILLAIGYTGWSFPEAPFWSICTFALIRAAGSSIIWINSTLLLQKMATEQMLGRVLAIDYALALLGESFAAYLCGILMDQANMSAFDISFNLAILSSILALIWGWYHVSGRGAGKYKPSSSSSSSSEKKNGVIKTTTTTTTTPDEESNLLPFKNS